MNTFRVFKFEFLNTVKKKSFFVTNLILMLIIIGVFSLQSIIGIYKSTFGSNKEIEKIGIFYESSAVNKKEMESNIKVPFVVTKSVEELKKLVQDGEVEGGYIVKGQRQYTVVYNNRKISDISGGRDDFDEAIREYNRKIDFGEKGFNYNEVQKIYNEEVQRDYLTLGKDSTSIFLPLYIMLVVIYMYYLMYGQGVATSVAREKSDKTMEILITSTSVYSLIVGKVLSGAVVGTLSMFLNFVAAAIGYFINQSNLKEIVKFVDFQGMGEPVLIFAVFLVLGYFLYLFIYASLGSLVSKVEEVAISTGSIQTIFVLVYFGAIIGINSPDGVLLKVMSFIPFSSPLTMFVRAAMTEVPLWQIGISTALMLLTILFFANLSIKLYRIGSLNYGNRVKLFKALKMLKEDKKK